MTVAAALVALLLAQEHDLFGEEAPPADAPPPTRPKHDDAPLVIPPPDGPVPDGVPKGVDAVPLKAPAHRPKDEERALLLVERQHLLDARPGFLVPTTVTTLGGLALVFGVTLTLLGLAAALRNEVQAPFAAGAALGFVGLGGFIFGLVWEREVTLAREPFNERIEAIDQELGW